MREMSVAEQRYQAVLAVISDGATVTEVAARFGVSRQSVHAWLARYEAGGLEGLVDGSHRPRSCPHQIGAEVEVEIVSLRRQHPGWGPRRLVFELGKRGVVPLPSESAVYRALARLNLIDPGRRRRRDRRWKRDTPRCGRATGASLGSLFDGRLLPPAGCQCRALACRCE